jgi:hypothetical protein
MSNSLPPSSSSSSNTKDNSVNDGVALPPGCVPSSSSVPPAAATAAACLVVSLVGISLASSSSSSSSSVSTPVTVYVRWPHTPKTSALFVSHLPSSLVFPVHSSHSKFMDYLKDSLKPQDSLKLKILLPKHENHATTIKNGIKCETQYSHLATAMIPLELLESLPVKTSNKTFSLPLISSLFFSFFLSFFLSFFQL